MILAICIHCEHAIKREEVGDYVCKKHPLPRDFDYVTGIMGALYYDLCSNHNEDGKCPLFKRRWLR